jgi:hypothetical protein
MFLDQIKKIFSNALVDRKGVKQQFNEQVENQSNNGQPSGGNGAGNVEQIASLVKNLPNTNGMLDNGIRSELLKLTVETQRGLDELKKAYLHRKTLLNKIQSEVSAGADPAEKSGLKAQIQDMMNHIDDRVSKFDDDKDKLNKEADLIKNKQI